MFTDAFELASGFTRPVIIAHLTADGECHHAVGTMVIVNRAGDFVTAAHLFTEADRIRTARDSFAGIDAARSAIEKDSSLNAKGRKKQLRALPAPKDAVKDYSIWWGADGVTPSNVNTVIAGDFAVGRLSPFDPNWVPKYPVFKDPSKPIRPGKSLFRTGFPFQKLTVTYGNNAFTINAQTLALFPN
jgi:hypothetical protein